MSNYEVLVSLAIPASIIAIIISVRALAHKLRSKSDKYITAELKRNLVAKIDPEKRYPVSYTYNQGRARTYKKTFLLGKELTENQIVDLWRNNKI